jgi:3-oxoacyl-[acyl-carrier protein] reductase
MHDLKGKVAIVTGASKGIGAAIARQLAEAGAAVAVNYASDKAGADRVVGNILRGGGKAVAIQADVSKSADVKRLFDETVAAFGRPSILVNNAGVYSFASLEDVTEAEFHRQFDINVLSTILTTRSAAATFDGQGGSVINISSIVYSASKAAVDTITAALAKELASRKIRVNAIAPGMTETEGLAVAGIEGETAKNIAAALPMRRLGKPADIARLAVFLASDDSAWLTGERITASGGQR